MGFKQEFSIGNKWIGQRHSTFIIGEAGVNHNGDISIAKKLIDVAISAGVDAVKFQSFKPEELILKSVEKIFQNQDLNYLGKCHSAKIVSMGISNNNSFHVCIKDLAKKYRKNINKL